jgi:glycosyltransferase involved in cell wall biosynthesis
MSNKKRILIANDASFLDTGYGVYGKEIIKRLHNSDKYEVAELGCYATLGDPRIQNIPWKFYANAVPANDNRAGAYKSSVINQFGAWRFSKCLLDFKPHIVFDVRDYWMYAYQEQTSLKKYFSWIIMPTTDSAPPKIDWLYTFANADLIVPYTDWAKKVLEQYCGKFINLHHDIANAGINPNEFYPISNKKEHQRKYFGKDVCITGLVMRNQKRKLLSDTMLAFRKYLDKLKANNQQDLYDKSYLYFHTSYPEQNGWDIPALLLEHGVLDKTYFTYTCKSCNGVTVSKFHGPLTYCDQCKKKSCVFAAASSGVKTEQLNEIYNLFDIFVQCAICEGFGMPQVEAAACGLKIASVDYSAMTEIVEKLGGIKIPVQRLFREMETNADRANPDIEAIADILYNYHVKTSEEIKINEGKIIRQKCIDTYSWDKVYQVWEHCFDKIDISQKMDWNTAKQSETNHSITVPNNLMPKDFVEYIVLNIIKEPELLNTANIQLLIKDFCSGISAGDGAMKYLTYENVVKTLESYLTNKIGEEQYRLAKDPIKEDFLQK